MPSSIETIGCCRTRPTIQSTKPGAAKARVDGRLIGRIEAAQRRRDLAAHMGDSAAHPLAAIARGITVTQFDSLARTG